MHIRLWTGLLSVLAVACVVVPFCRVPAGEITVPAEATVERCQQSCESLVVGTTPDVPALLVNTRRIRLNYNISDVGPSGVAHVELWATRDGQRWARYSKEPPPAGPMVVHVAEEGRYGFSLVVRSGVGLSSPAPKTGDAPQMWVEVDETAPVVTINKLTTGKGVDHGTLSVSYSAKDVNLDSRPVTISYGATRAGPWTTVVGQLDDAGSYVWNLPKDVPYEFYIRVEAIDRAGNVGYTVCQEPIRIDHATPRGTITGIDGDRAAKVKTLAVPQAGINIPAPVEKLEFGVGVNYAPSPR